MTIKHLQRRLDALDARRQCQLDRERDRELAELTDAELKAAILERLESEDPEMHARYVAASEAEKEIIYEQFVTDGLCETRTPVRGGRR